MHLHAYLQLHRKVNIGDPAVFDIEGYHPNMQGVRSNADVIKYVTKDGNFVSSFTLEEIEAIKTARMSKTAIIGKSLIEEGLTYNLIKNHPEMATKDLAKLQANVNIIRMLKLKEETKAERKTFQQVAEDHPFPDIVRSINVTPENKKCHLWLTGPPNSGKTYFVEKLLDLGI